MGLSGRKYFIKIILTLKLRSAYLKYQMCQVSIKSGHFNFGTNLSPAGGKYLIKIIFDMKIEIEIFEISLQPNFDNFRAFLILGPFWA